MFLQITIVRRTLKLEVRSKDCLSGCDMYLCTAAVDIYGFVVGGVNNEWFFCQWKAEELCSLCMTTEEVFLIALATSFSVKARRLKHIVAQYDNEGTLATLFCNRLTFVAYSAMFSFLTLFSTSLSITWFLNFLPNII